MIIRQIKKRPVQQVSVDMEGIFSQQAQTRRAAERVAGKDRYLYFWQQYRYIKGIEDGRAT